MRYQGGSMVALVLPLADLAVVWLAWLALTIFFPRPWALWQKNIKLIKLRKLCKATAP
jgi:hypothetical protein